MELERAAFLEVQAKSEEDRKALLARISQFEEEKSRDMESVLQHHREQWREAANRESELMRASLEATHSRNLKDLERHNQARAGESHASVLKELDEWKAECTRLQNDREAEQRARAELEQRHAAARAMFASAQQSFVPKSTETAAAGASVDQSALELREASLKKFLSLPKHWTRKARSVETDHFKQPLGGTRARRMLLFENAAALGDVEWLQALLNAGVDIDGKNLFGQTALFLASWYGHTEAVKILLRHGAKAIPASGGVTPLEAAAAHHHGKIVDVLRSFGHVVSVGTAAEFTLSGLDLVPKLLLPEAGMVGSWFLSRSFQEDSLQMLDDLGKSLPVPETEMGRRAAERLFFCDAVGHIKDALTHLLRQAQFEEVHVSPWLRFLRYKRPNIPLVPHVDYEWLPGYISAELPGYGPSDFSTTHTLLLYLTDCCNGGETWLLDGTPDQCPDSPEPLACIPARRGCILLFPHQRLHMGTALKQLPKMMLRADVRLGAAPGIAVEDAAKLRDDQQRLQAAHAAEERAKEAVSAKHQEVLADMEKLKGDKLELEKDQAAEKQARLMAEQKHAAALEDAERLKADQEKLQADKVAEQAARQEAERQHQSVLKDMEQVRADHQRVSQEKEAEARLRAEAESKHASVVNDMQKLQEDHSRLKADKDAEERAKLEVQRLHEEVLKEKTSGHGHLQELLEAEKRATEEMRQRHAAVEGDKQKMAQDQARLQEDKARESQLRAEAERKHEELMRDMQKLRDDQQRLAADKDAESQAKAEAERRHAAVLQDLEKLTADKQKLQADTAAERKAKEEAEKKHLEVLQDREQISSDMRALQRDKDSETLAKEEIARKHEAALKQLDLVNADQAKLRLDKEAESRARADLDAKHQVVLREKEELQAQHQKLQQDRDRLAALQGSSVRDHEEAYVKMKTAHEAELKQTKESGLQLKAEWEARHQDLLQELEKLRAEHRRLQQEKDDERRGRERVNSDHQTALRDAESIKIQLDGLQARSAGDRASLEEANSRLRTLQAERDTLASDVNTLKKLKEEKSKAEDDLREALDEQKAEVKLLQKQLEEREHQARQVDDKRRVQEEKLSSLLSQLADEKKDAEELRRELQQVRLSGEQFQKDAQDSLQNISRDWQQKYDDLQKENEALKQAAASRARTNSDAEMRRRMTAHRMSLWAEPMNFLAGLEEEAQLLPSSNAEIVLQVRKAHKELDENLQNATEVHIKSIEAQLEGVTAAENKGMPLRRGLTDYERKTEVESERHSEHLSLDARLHDLKALQEEVALEHSLSESEQQQIRDYLQRDMKRCEEELEILKPTSALASVPDQLIQVLQTMPEDGLPERFEHGFSPMHWAAQQGRRDIVEFIRRLVEGGHGLLASRDDQGRTPLFYAERGGRVGLAYHLRRVGGSAEEPFRPALERPQVDTLPAAYQQVLRQVETRGWHSMKWKEDYTMLHWAASKGHKDLALYLISLNANPNARDSKNRSPAACASEAGNADLVALLQEKATAPRRSIATRAFGGFDTE
ncbi:HYDIN [Symbiodinium pilosum]|uniref:HYDIN protein n=1 Tax=Symbiodinium pilosum TaxID=2952 RepID=A0A812XLS8_SYMPI|nr:HYDIN [Symbiodinium pilosum]